MLIVKDTPSPRYRACTAAVLAPSLSCSPTLRATIAVAPIPKPIASEYRMLRTDSVYPTAATALLSLSILTKNMSTTAKMDSIPISTIMGIANKKMALLILPSVKFCSEPLMASLNKRNREAVFVKAAFMQKENLKLI